MVLEDVHSHDDLRIVDKSRDSSDENEFHLAADKFDDIISIKIILSVVFLSMWMNFAPVICY